jgi:hypothetical protein
MPANLTPDYYAAEERYKAARTNAEKIAGLEDMLSVIPKHKGTDKLQADLKRRIASLKKEGDKKQAVSRGDPAYRIPREGAGQVIVCGPANTGKSSLVAALTNARPAIERYPGSTVRPLPGMMPFENIQIQLVDTPPLDMGYVEPECIELFRRIDLVCIVADITADAAGQVEQTASFLAGHRIADPGRRGGFDGARVWEVPFLVFVNKHDDRRTDEDVEIFRDLTAGAWRAEAGSALTGLNLDALKRAVFDSLGIIRVFAKPRGREPDMTAPFVLKKGGTIQDFAAKVHKDFVDHLKTARIWGDGVFDGQMAPRDFVLRDGHVVELQV